jgi:murein DD-endopeptidase MepM/ murein hydrolase activator NlpD
MIKRVKLKYAILCELILLVSLASFFLFKNYKEKIIDAFLPNSETNTEYIKWVDFNVSSSAMGKAYDYDVASQTKEVKLNWIELLAYLGCRYGGDFSRYKEKDLNELVNKLESKEETMNTLTEGLKYYNYYYEAYNAVLGGFVGEYEIQVASEENPEEKTWVKQYGLKAFLPIAKYFPYSDYDDFGVSRSYGYKRRHLGHDMMGQVGTPVVAVESGYVEALGWNQYGGWRIGVRSFDGKRYYYYAHLRKNFPYNKSLAVGSVVQAGDVIGYLGRTGYSANENVNNIDTPHLHFGMQLIFDESQKEGMNEIWIDCYDIIKFLYRNRSETVKNAETKEWNRIYEFKDPEVDIYIQNKDKNPGNIRHNTDETPQDNGESGSGSSLPDNQNDQNGTGNQDMAPDQTN